MYSQKELDSLLVHLPMDFETSEFSREVFPRVLKEIQEARISRTPLGLSTSDDIESCAKILLEVIGILESFRNTQAPENRKEYCVDDWEELRRKSIHQLREISQCVRKSRTSFRIGQFLGIKENTITDPIPLKTPIEEIKQHLLIDKEATINIGELFRLVNKLQRSLHQLFKCDIMDLLSKEPTQFQILCSRNRNLPEFDHALKRCVHEIYTHKGNVLDRNPHLEAAVITVAFSIIFVRYDTSLFVMMSSEFRRELSAPILDEAVESLNSVDSEQFGFKIDERKISEVADKLQEELDFIMRFNEFFDCFLDKAKLSSIDKCTIL